MANTSSTTTQTPSLLTFRKHRRIVNRFFDNSFSWCYDDLEIDDTITCNFTLSESDLCECFGIEPPSAHSYVIFIVCNLTTDGMGIGFCLMDASNDIRIEYAHPTRLVGDLLPALCEMDNILLTWLEQTIPTL